MSFHLVPLCALLASLLVVGGCSGGPASTMEAGRYRSQEVPLYPELSRMSPGEKRSLRVRAFATCEWAGCTPGVVEVAFSNQGSSDAQGNYRSVRIEADSAAKLWEGIEYGSPDQRSIPTGVFLRLGVEPDFFRAMAEAEEVHVVLGSTLYRLPYGRRDTFREMAAAMGVGPAEPAPAD